MSSFRHDAVPFVVRTDVDLMPLELAKEDKENFDFVLPTARARIS